MPSLLVAKDLQIRPVERRGIISVPGEMAKLRCEGVELKSERFPVAGSGRQLYQALLAAAKAMVSQQRVRGLDYWDREGIHVYGPFPSYELHHNLLNADDFNLRNSADPRVVAQYSKRRATTIGAFADYLLVAKFLARDVVTEVPVKEGHG